MSLEMRGGWERCRLALAEGGAVFDCSYECTFCERCTARARFGGRTIPHDYLPSGNGYKVRLLLAQLGVAF